MRAEQLPGRIESLVSELLASNAPDEALAEFVPARGFGPFVTAERFRATGRAWRLGVLLVDAAGQLYSTGEITRAIEPGRAAVNRSALGERRRALRAIAAHSGFTQGEVVNFGFAKIDSSPEALTPESEPLLLEDGVVVVRVDRASGSATDLERYLAERVALLEGGPDQVFA